MSKIPEGIPGTYSVIPPIGAIIDGKATFISNGVTSKGALTGIWKTGISGSEKATVTSIPQDGSSLTPPEEAFKRGLTALTGTKIDRDGHLVNGQWVKPSPRRKR